eukprot:jgi/Botrbrau1/19138/Bobra.0077s0050.1
MPYALTVPRRTSAKLLLLTMCITWGSQLSMASVARLRIHTKRFEEVSSRGHDPRPLFADSGDRSRERDPAGLLRSPGIAREHSARERPNTRGTGGLQDGREAEGVRTCTTTPKFDQEWVQSPDGLAGGGHTCIAYKLVCLDQSMVVMHDPMYNMRDGSDMPKFDITSLGTTWRAPKNDPVANAIHNGRIRFDPLVFRPPVAGDPKPVFSNCTLPVILFKDKENSFNHMLLTLLPQIYYWHHEGAASEDVTYVLGTPWGSEVPKFLHPILRPFSKYEVTSLADFSSRLPASAPSRATAEGRHVRCFQKVAFCIEEGAVRPVRVLIETRPGPVRNLDNREELVRQCNEAGGPWECRMYSMGSDFLRNLAAVRSADVFVFIHGSAGANLVFMRNDTAAVEVMPLGFAGIADPGLSRPGKWGECKLWDASLYVRDRHVTLPWKALRAVLEKIGSLRGSRDKYEAMEKAGENLVEVSENGELRRSPQWDEWFAVGRIQDLRELGVRPMELVQEAKALAKEGSHDEAGRRKLEALTLLERLSKGLTEARTRLNQLVEAGRAVNETLFQDIREGTERLGLLQIEVQSEMAI